MESNPLLTDSIRSRAEVTGYGNYFDISIFKNIQKPSPGYAGVSLSQAKTELNASFC
jgi:hypothetical protein